jgi:outer membrane protein, multidrug efflux system
LSQWMSTGFFNKSSERRWSAWAVSVKAGLVGASVLLAGCTVGPNYKRPTATTPVTWDVQDPWRESAPKDAVPKGQWWIVFHDDQLNSLEQQALDANQTIKVSLARVEQARATAAIQISTLFPTLGISPSSTTPSIERGQASNGRSIGTSTATTGGTGGTGTGGTGTGTGTTNAPVANTAQNTFTIPFVAGYEVDLFGRRRRSIEAAEANYQASAADLENVRLMVTSELAGDYFSLRELDSEIGILNRTVEALQKGLDLVNSRHNGGVASGLDVAQEETLLLNTRTQYELRHQARRNFQDAISVLLGKPAPDFRLEPNELKGIAPPTLNAGIPSDVLERRPDIAEAERQMASANAQIGVAVAAYYPTLDLFATAGPQVSDFAKIANLSSFFWAFGANISEEIFTGGARRAQVQYARAGFDATVANYRGVTLNAFREVQDDLTALDVFLRAQGIQQQAVDAARRTVDLSTSRYNGGLVSYLDVVTAQQALLQNEQQLVSIQGQRLTTSILLVKALGGGWDASSLEAIKVKARFKDIIAP